MNASKILLSFVAGAAIGAALGVLFAPDKGTETRKKIADKSHDVADSIKDGFNDFVDGIKDKFKQVKSDAEDVAEKGISAYNKGRAQTSGVI
ncbi:MAG: YtxH domain-containing protein [Bacteroidetes bacterium]|nr:MAG: YtxH domain-containing protein [Bacteroidota bacterium]